ncbi:MAG: GTPase KRas precursor [Candidatus Heimdallarchaeota archaeon LC_3]|nr:MAG: GTPase KRas precursor [Candidatus Heimdallarchaeota archaeon LC_3]
MINLSNLLKILLLGDGAVGKTSTIHRYIENKFSNTYAATIGVDILNTRVITKSGEKLDINIWDIAGQIHFRAIRSKFYRGTSAAILIFDVTNKKTLDNIPSWISEAKELVSSDIPMILVGNKKDLDHLRQVDKFAINKESDSNNNIFAVFETSALTGEGIGEVFQTMAEKLLSI